MDGKQWMHSLIAGRGSRGSLDPFRESLLRQLDSNMTQSEQEIYVTNLPMDTQREQTPSQSDSQKSQKK